MNFYNELDPAAAAWLRELIAVGAIPPGVVDERSISDLQPSDLHGYTQCHFFAGIGGWSLALQLAEIDSSRPLWTGSCPCQPYSAAGKGLGDEDPRNLWPAFFRLIRECRPELVLGEQVESAVGHGWLDRVSADLEGEGYACGAAVLGAHSVLAPHIRQRLYWVADATGSRHTGTGQGKTSDGNRADSLPQRGNSLHEPSGSGTASWVADAQLARRAAPGLRPEINAGRESEPGRASSGMAEPHRVGSAAGIPGPEQGQEGFSGEPDDGGGERLGRLADAERDDRRPDQPERGPEGRAADGRACGGAGSGGMGDADQQRHVGEPILLRPEEDGRNSGDFPQAAGGGSLNPWSDSVWLPCRDGKHRRIPTEPALFPLADGLPYKLARRGSIRPALLKGAGNAIVPQVAAEFISAYLETLTP